MFLVWFDKTTEFWEGEMKPKINSKVKIGSYLTGTIAGSPCLVENELLWPIKLDQPFYCEYQLTFVSILLVHADNFQMVENQ